LLLLLNLRLLECGEEVSLFCPLAIADNWIDIGLIRNLTHTQTFVKLNPKNQLISRALPKMSVW
jgi:hypothetical protein